MIYYFSGTGNSKYVAQRLAETLNETIYDMAMTCDKHTDAESLGFVMPVYYWGIPNIVLDFLKDLRIDGKPNIFPAALVRLERCLKRQSDESAMRNSPSSCPTLGLRCST